MKKLLLPLCILAFAACNKTPRTEVVDNNPRYCWTCKFYQEGFSDDGSFNSRTEKDTIICDKLGIEITDIMQHKDSGSVTIGSYTYYNVRGVDKCKIQ